MSLSDEMALVTKLISLDLPCRTVFDGLTTREVRREMVRPSARKVADVTFTIRNGRRITIEEQFMVAYKDEL